MESSAHRTGKPDDSNSLMSKLTDRSAGLVIGFEVEATPHAGVQAHAKETQKHSLHIYTCKQAARDHHAPGGIMRRPQ